MFTTLTLAKSDLCREAVGSEDGWYLLPLLEGEEGERWAELGAGCGELSLQAAVRNPGVRLDALEIQPELALIAQANSVASGLADRVRVFAGDVCHPPSSLLLGGYDQVFCNPPFFASQAGRLPKKRVRAIARFELLGTLVDFLACAALLLRELGQFHLVHRPERLLEIMSTLSAQRLQPFRLIPVYSQLGVPARLVLLSARKGGREKLTLGVPRVG